MMENINGWVFLIKYDELLKKYNHGWNKVSNCIQKKLDWEPAYRASLFFKPECI